MGTIHAQYATSDEWAPVITGHDATARYAQPAPTKVARREAATYRGGTTMPLVPWDGRLLYC
jgi:hypothetical protein